MYSLLSTEQVGSDSAKKGESQLKIESSPRANEQATRFPTRSLASSSRNWGPFLEAPGNYRARQAVLFFILDSSFKRFENCTVKLSAKETKWTPLEIRTHPTILENLISKYDFGPVKLPGLSRNGPLMCYFENELVVFTNSFFSVSDADGCVTGTLVSCWYIVILCLRQSTEIRRIPLKPLNAGLE